MAERAVEPETLIEAGREGGGVGGEFGVTLFDQYCVDLFSAAERSLHRKYGIDVSVFDIKPDTIFGNLDGTEIDVDVDVSAQEKLFILLHLFGHTVQWNSNDAAREIGLAAPPENKWSDSSETTLTAEYRGYLESIKAYEAEASGYGMTLLDSLCEGMEMPAQMKEYFNLWLSREAAKDWVYLSTYYITGEKLVPSEIQLSPDEVSPLTPAPIPEFELHHYATRKVI